MDPNPYVTCPFNPQHRMSKLRLQYHIVKCQKNYASAGLKPCPYNATHFIAIEKYREHIQTCPDALLIEGPKYNKGNEIHGKLNEGAFHFHVDQDESWDLPETEESSASQVSENLGSDNKDYDYLNLVNEFEEDEEPLQRSFYEETKSKRLSSSDTHSSRKGNIPGIQNYSNEGDQKEEAFRQFGVGRGSRILSILTSLQK